MADIQWSDIVGDKTIDNGGYVGDLMTIARNHIDDAVSKQKLTNAQAGEIYAAMIPSAFQNGIGFAMQEELTEAKIDNEEDKLVTAEKNRDVLVAQKALIERQAKGFDDDAKQKLLKQSLDSWAVAYSVAKDANAIPDSIKVNPIDSIMKSAMDGLSIVTSTDPLGEA